MQKLRFLWSLHALSHIMGSESHCLKKCSDNAFAIHSIWDGKRFNICYRFHWTVALKTTALNLIFRNQFQAIFIQSILGINLQLDAWFLGHMHFSTDKYANSLYTFWLHSQPSNLQGWQLSSGHHWAIASLGVQCHGTFIHSSRSHFLFSNVASFKGSMVYFQLNGVPPPSSNDALSTLSLNEKIKGD